MGIEPTSSAWEAEVLPLNYTRRASNAGSLLGNDSMPFPVPVNCGFGKMHFTSLLTLAGYSSVCGHVQTHGFPLPASASTSSPLDGTVV